MALDEDLLKKSPDEFYDSLTREQKLCIIVRESIYCGDHEAYEKRLREILKGRDLLSVQASESAGPHLEFLTLLKEYEQRKNFKFGVEYVQKRDTPLYNQFVSGENGG